MNQSAEYPEVPKYKEGDIWLPLEPRHPPSPTLNTRTHLRSYWDSHIILCSPLSKFQAFNQELRMVPSSPDPIPFACWLSYTISCIGPPMFRPVPVCSNCKTTERFSHFSEGLSLGISVPKTSEPFLIINLCWFICMLSIQLVLFF